MKGIKRLALVLALTLLLGLLSGCDLSEIEKLGAYIGLSGKQFDTQMESPVQTDAVVTAPVETEVVELREGFVREQLRVRSGAGTGYDQVTQLSPGTQVYVGKTVYADQALWGQTEQGWICLDDVYFVEEEGENPGYAVVREQGAEVCDVILGFRNTRKSLEFGQRLTVQEQLETNNGERWIYASGGWINGADVYVEGTVGNRACTGVIQDPTGTPLNIRSGPGTDFEKRGTLANGTYVEVLEQLKRKNKDWGYVEVNGVSGWIFMDYVDRGY